MKIFVTLLAVICGVGLALSGGVDNPVLDTTHTNYLAGDTEIVVTGDPRSGSNVLSIASSIARDTELASYLPLAGGTMTGPVNFGVYTQIMARVSGDNGRSASIVLDSEFVQLYSQQQTVGAGGVEIWNDAPEASPVRVFRAPCTSLTPYFDYNLEVKSGLTVGGTTTLGGAVTMNQNGSNWVHSVGTLNGTNGVYWVTGTTTNWLLF